jgi:hypothetical protein
MYWDVTLNTSTPGNNMHIARFGIHAGAEWALAILAKGTTVGVRI